MGVNDFLCDYVLLYNSRLRFFAGKLLSFHDFCSSSGVGDYHSGKGNPMNVETNIIEIVTPEEYIRDTFQNVPDSEKE